MDPDQLGVEVVHRQRVHGGGSAGDVQGQVEIVGQGAHKGGDTGLPARLRRPDVRLERGVGAGGVQVDLDDVAGELPADPDRVREPGNPFRRGGRPHGFEACGVGLREVDHDPAELGENGGLAPEHGVDGLHRYARLGGDRLQRGG